MKEMIEEDEKGEYGVNQVQPQLNNNWRRAEITPSKSK